MAIYYEHGNILASAHGNATLDPYKTLNIQHDKYIDTQEHNFRAGDFDCIMSI